MGDAETMGAFIDQLLESCPLIRSIWLVSDAVSERRWPARRYTWDLVAFADPFTLQRLRRKVRLHRTDVRLRVLDGGNRLEPAWGNSRDGVCVASDWLAQGPRDGHYTESAAAAPGSLRDCARRRATCVWQGIDPLKGPGS